MAQQRASSVEAWGAFAALAAQRKFRKTSWLAPVCIALLCASFGAAALLQMRLDRAHAAAQAQAYEQIRAGDLAQAAAAGLARMEAAGRHFAAMPGSTPDEPAIRNIALTGPGGALIAASNPAAALPTNQAARVFAFGPQAGISFAAGARRITVLFDPAALAPMGARMALLLPGGAVLAHGAGFTAPTATVPVPGWPLAAATALDQTAAGWMGALPLYLFVILGPSVAGAWLAALLVGAFARQEKAQSAVRALKSVRPVEGKLMVRLALAERAALEAARSKSEFIAHMSHELRTPLNAVIGFSEVIASGLYGPVGHAKYAEYANDIAGAGRQLHARIGDILEFANIEAGRHPLSLERVELAALAEAALEDHKGRAFSRRIRLDAGACVPGFVRADPLALRRILSNLLDNALCYTAPGGAVRLEVRMEEGAGLITIADSGMGFSGAEKNRAGRAFQRFDRPGTVTGAGLGLAIAMELARRMGGAMNLASAQGQGSIMSLRLPIALPVGSDSA